MMHCDSCGVSYSGELNRCPLCAARLEGSPTAAVFPVREVQRTRTLGRRLLGAATLACLAVALICWRAIPLSVPGGLALVVGIAITYLFVRNLMVHSPDFLRVTERYFLVVLAIAALCYVATGNDAIITFIIPFISLAAALMNTILLAVYRGAFVTGYAKYLLYTVVLGMLPVAFVPFGLTSTPAPAFLSVGAALLLAFLLVLLARTQSTEEARKLFSA